MKNYVYWSELFGSDSFAELLPLFSNYSDFLQRNLHQYFPRDLMLGLANAENAISVDRVPASGERQINCANLAAACETFHGWTIDAGAISEEHCAEFLQKNIQSSGTPSTSSGKSWGFG